MKPFKFLTTNTGKYIRYDPPTNGINFIQRRYFGIERGIINWLDHPVSMIYYIEPRASFDPVDEDSILQINMEVQSQLITVNTANYMSFEQFMDINSEKYIFLYTVEESDGTQHTNENTIPIGVPLIIRSAILD